MTQKQTEFQDTFSEEIWRTTYRNYKDQSVNDTFRRVAKDIASAENTEEKKQYWEEQFYDLLTDFKGVAGGRITANAGTDWNGTTFMNCFVGGLPEYNIDSLEGIYQVLQEQSKTLKSEGGWGMDFSWIRPRGSFIAGIGVESPGAVRFMELFDKSSEIVTSGSGKKNNNKKSKEKIRKGAQMGTMAVWHPDIIEFITAKQSSGRLSKFNLSVNCTEEFMQKVNALEALRESIEQAKNNKQSFALDDQDSDWKVRLLESKLEKEDTWNLEFPETSHEKYKSEWKGDLKDWKAKGYPVVIHNTVKVSWLWNLIMESTYNRNEPGILFLDRANEYNPLSYAENILSTNP